MAVCEKWVFPLSDVFQHGKLGLAPSTLRQLIERGESAMAALGGALDACRTATSGYAIDEVTIKTPIADPKKIILIGVNYRDHIEEMKVTELPKFPYAFLRPQTSLAAHGETIKLPEWPQLIDWEAELGVIIGREIRPGSWGDDQHLLSSVAGYTVINDVSARDWIASRPPVGIDWVMQKAWDRFQPTGPWITPAKFVADPQTLSIELTVNGVTRQKSNTSQMVFSIAKILRHLSNIMTLEPGDIIATGTPAGVGFARKPIETIKAGDEISVSIGSLGILTNTFA